MRRLSLCALSAAAVVLRLAGAAAQTAAPVPPDVDVLLHHLDDLYRSRSSVARIEIERRPGVLRVPLPALRDRGGSKVVLRRRGATTEAVAVEVLGVGGGVAALGGGVEEGDVVLLGGDDAADAPSGARPGAGAKGPP